MTLNGATQVIAPNIERTRGELAAATLGPLGLHSLFGGDRGMYTADLCPPRESAIG